MIERCLLKTTAEKDATEYVVRPYSMALDALISTLVVRNFEKQTAASIQYLGDNAEMLKNRLEEDLKDHEIENFLNLCTPGEWYEILRLMLPGLSHEHFLEIDFVLGQTLKKKLLSDIKEQGRDKDFLEMCRKYIVAFKKNV